MSDFGLDRDATTKLEKNFQIETFDLKSVRDERWHELATRRNDDGSIGRPGLVQFSSVRPVMTKNGKDQRGHYVSYGATGRATWHPLFVSTWSIAFPIRLSARRRERDWSIPTGPCPKKQRRSRYWRRHPALHAQARAAQKIA